MKTCEILVKRLYKLPTYTIGKLYVDGVYVCDTLEDKDRGLRQNMPLNEIYRKKVYGETAIPVGRYFVDMDTESPKFKYRIWAKPYGGKLPRLLSVPGFDGILIHPGTDESSTMGCILPGINKQKGKVLDSQKSFFKLMNEYLVPAKRRGEEVWITIE